MSSFRLLTMVNDSFVDQLSVADRGLAFGDGLFETMRLDANRIPMLDYHLQRLEAGCRTLAIPISRAFVELALQKFLAAVSLPGPLIIKLIVTRGVGGQGCQAPTMQDTSPTLILQYIPLSDTTHQAQSGVALQLCSIPLYPNPHLAGIKHLNRLNYVMAAAELPQTHDVQGLLLDDRGNVLESLHHNLFYVKDRQLVTPRLDRAGVRGVLRRVILERLAAAEAIQVHEADFSVDTLSTADEIFLTNGVRGIWPVKAFAGRSWHVPGPVTRQLQARVEEIFAAGSLGGGKL